MAKRSKKETRNRQIFYILAVISVIIAALSRAGFLNINNNLTLDENSIAVYFLDVGQGSSTVIQDGNSAVLIDSGESENSRKIIDFLSEKGISKLEYVIATHFHSDHIGGLSNILQNVECGNVYLPLVDDAYAPTTKTYYKLLETIDNKNLNVSFVTDNTAFIFGKTTFNIIAPAEQADDMNNMSLIIKAVYGDASFLIPGDAENKEMKSVMKANKNLDLSSDIYLMAHHGSNTSLNKEFLSKINMKIAIISCGKDNSYGHPHEEALEYLNDNNIEYYRTDEVGTITVISDGESYNITTQYGDHE